jgi:hypothetical protein
MAQRTQKDIRGWQEEDRINGKHKALVKPERHLDIND